MISKALSTLLLLPLLAAPAGAALGCAPAPETSNEQPEVNEDASRVFESGFVGIGHAAGGTARIEQDESGAARVLFLDDFFVDNGPALIVGLSPQPVDGMSNGNAWPAGTLELGLLKGASGAQSYEVPAGTDLDSLESVVIWCETFSVVFAGAALEAPPGD